MYLRLPGMKEGQGARVRSRVTARLTGVESAGAWGTGGAGGRGQTGVEVGAAGKGPEKKGNSFMGVYSCGYPPKH